MRIHKNFIKETIDKNFEVVLGHVETNQEKNAFLTEINANIENLSFRIQPVKGWNDQKLETELFFDDGQIVMEINGLAYVGQGRILDPESGQVEDISLEANLDLAQVVISLDQVLQEDGNLLPKLEITEVNFTLLPESFVIKTQGDLPLYKTRTFEQGIRNWMIEHIRNREKEFKAALQKAESDIMASFAFKKKLVLGSTAHSSLSETMQLVDDHVVISFDTDFDGGPDLTEVKQKTRHTKTKFSDSNEAMRDLQVVIDENYVNYQLFNLFYQENVYSLTELLLEYIPDNFPATGPLIKGILNTKVWSYLFPELTKDYG